MNTPVYIPSIFPKHLFWDVDYTQLDVEYNRALIIPRALYMTNKRSFENDILKLEMLYSPEQILHEIKLTTEKVSKEVRDLVINRYISEALLNNR